MLAILLDQPHTHAHEPLCVQVGDFSRNKCLIFSHLIVTSLPRFMGRNKLVRLGPNVNIMPEARLFTAVMFLAANFLLPDNKLFVQKTDRCFLTSVKLFQRSLSFSTYKEVKKAEKMIRMSL